MLTYFTGLALIVVPALLLTAAAGIWHDGSDRHITAGLVTAILTVSLHTLLIMFLLVTGRVLREAVRVGSLSGEHLAELNRFFTHKRAYPCALVGAVLIVVAGVAGEAQLAFPMPAGTHMLLGLGAVLFNLWAIQVEFRALRDNQTLLDRAAQQMNARALDTPPPADEADPNATAPAVRWLLAAGSAWLPYLYWGLIVWKGDFSSIGATLPFLCGAASLAGLLAATWARRRSRAPGARNGPA